MITMRGAVVAVMLTLAGAASAHAQGAAGAGASCTPTKSTQPTGAGQANFNNADSSYLPVAANAATQAQNGVYEPITMKQRLQWLASITLGPSHLAAGVVVSGLTTADDRPSELGTHWAGFGERYGLRFGGLVAANTLEAGLGAFWGEDPRYRREPEKSFGGRMASVVEQAFLTRRRDGQFQPAYARFMAISGSNFLSNTLRPSQEADSYHATIRTLYGFGGQIGSNAWDEFWPSISRHIFHHNQ